ncbi:hypothetical protein OROGR_021438 [Orobanche gracilis]
MASVEEKLTPGGSVNGVQCNILEGMKLLKEMNDHTGVRNQINSGLWHACAGPLVTLPQIGGLVYYFPQGHSEQDEKSQLLLGVRRVSRQQTALPSSVLSADSMHIGVLAAAAHAAASRSPFTIFYNPRACPSDFVIPFAKYQKAVYSTQLSVGMRFGMMFETEESTKRRYMGTITGISDLDPLRWPNSKWRSLQVEWDEPGCGDKRNRVSPWEIETPESLFIFPSLTANLKRPFHSAFIGAQTEWETVVNRPPFLWHPDNAPLHFQCPSISTSPWSDHLMKLIKQPLNNRAISTGNMYAPMQNAFPQEANAPKASPQGENGNFTNSSVVLLPGKPASLTNQLNGVDNEYPVMDQNNTLQTDVWNTQSRLDSHVIQTQQIGPTEVGPTSPNTLLQSPGAVEFKKSDQPSASPDTACNVLTSLAQETWDPNFTNANQDVFGFQYDSCNLKDLSSENNNQSSDIYRCLNLDGSNSGSTVVDPLVSSIVFEDFCNLRNADFHKPSDYLVENFCPSQDVQSQITSASLADSQNFSIQEYADNSGGASSSNVDFEDNTVLQHGSWQQVTPRFRTYTKIQKAGSVGRSIDVSSFRNYDELCHEIERMFGLKGFLNDMSSGWKLVYVDFENDVLLVGDDPWEEFVGCVKCIRILSPSEVQQMGGEGMRLLNSVQGVNGLPSEVGFVRDGS